MRYAKLMSENIVGPSIMKVLLPLFSDNRPILIARRAYVTEGRVPSSPSAVSVAPKEYAKRGIAGMVIP